MDCLGLSSCVVVKFRPEHKVFDVLSLSISAFFVLPLLSPPHLPPSISLALVLKGAPLQLADQADSAPRL